MSKHSCRLTLISSIKLFFEKFSSQHSFSIFLNASEILFSFFNLHNYEYKTWISMYWVNVVGFIVFFSFFIQFFSGILLSVYYNSFFIISFYSIGYLLYDVVAGCLLKSIHSLFSVLFMFLVYIHLLRGV